MSLHRLPSASMFQHDAAASCGQQESKIEHFCCSSKATPCSVCDRKHILTCAVASSCRDSRSAPASSDGARERRSCRKVAPPVFEKEAEMFRRTHVELVQKCG